MKRMNLLRVVSLSIFIFCLPLKVFGERLFEPHSFFPSGGESPWAILSDVDNDDDLDIVVANADNTDNVCTFLGNGNGTFAQTPICFPSGGDGPASVAADYLNADSYPDLVVPNQGSDNICVFLGIGDGTFQQPTSCIPSIGDIPTKLVIGSINTVADAHLDLALVNFYSNDVCVFLGDGSGNFSPSGCYATAEGGNPNSIAKGDLNTDSYLDLVVSNRSTDDVSVLLGNGDGTFQAVANYQAGDHPISVAVGDLDGEGGLDLAVANFWSSDVCVLRGNGDGTFVAPGVGDCYEVGYGYDYGPSWIAIGSLNKLTDTHMDLVTVSYSNWVDVLLGNGDGTFQTPPEIYQVGAHPNSVVTGDLDGDGDLDLVVANGQSDTISVLRNTPCIDRDGDGYGDPASEYCTFLQLDCDDGDDTIQPGAYEGPIGHSTCTDGVNNDCDGWADGSDPGCQDQATWYVDASAGRRGTGLLEEPFETIGEALSVINAGDRIEVADGTYQENLVWPDVQDVGLHSASADPSACILEAANGSAPVVSGTFGSSGFRFIPVTIEGMTVRGGSEGIQLNFTGLNMGKVSLFGNVIELNTNRGVLIEAEMGEEALLTENRIRENGAGVELGIGKVVLTSNTVSDNDYDGIVLKARGGDPLARVARVIDNEVSWNGQAGGTHGIRIGDGTGYFHEVKLMDNRIHDNETDYGAQILVVDGDLHRVSSNRVYDNTGAVAGLQVEKITQASQIVMEVSNNRVYGNGLAEGLRIVDGGGGSLSDRIGVANNLVYGNRVGMHVSRVGETDAVVVNNTVADNSEGGFSVAGSAGLVDLTNMILWNNVDDIWMESLAGYGLLYSDVQDTGGENEQTGGPPNNVIHSDPQFVGDYKLAVGSDCIGSGEDGVDMGYTGGEGGDNTDTGAGVYVAVNEGENRIATVSFKNVNGPGRTWGHSEAYHIGVPEAFKVCEDLGTCDRVQFVDINTDAGYTGGETDSVTACVYYVPSWFPEEKKIVLLHKEDGEKFKPAANIVVYESEDKVCGEVAGLSAFVVAYPACVDEDEDGYGDPASEDCPHSGRDCDDGDPAVHPGATEGPPGDATCSDGKDNDCDLGVDTGDAGCVEGSCSASAAASVPGANTSESRANGSGLLCHLLPLGIVGILLSVTRRMKAIFR